MDDVDLCSLGELKYQRAMFLNSYFRNCVWICTFCTLGTIPLLPCPPIYSLCYKQAPFMIITSKTNAKWLIIAEYSTQSLNIHKAKYMHMHFICYMPPRVPEKNLVGSQSSKGIGVHGRQNHIFITCVLGSTSSYHTDDATVTLS